MLFLVLFIRQQPPHNQTTKHAPSCRCSLPVVSLIFFDEGDFQLYFFFFTQSCRASTVRRRRQQPVGCKMFVWPQVIFRGVFVTSEFVRLRAHSLRSDYRRILFRCGHSSVPLGPPPPSACNTACMHRSDTSTTPFYLRSAYGALIVWDMTNRDSWQRVCSFVSSNSSCDRHGLSQLRMCVCVCVCFPHIKL